MSNRKIAIFIRTRNGQRAFLIPSSNDLQLYEILFLTSNIQQTYFANLNLKKMILENVIVETVDIEIHLQYHIHI